jgi:hypothetical protein
MVVVMILYELDKFILILDDLLSYNLYRLVDSYSLILYGHFLIVWIG